MHLNPAFYLLLILLLVTGGCATMNQSECTTADWDMIGMGDGSRGYLESYIDNHRRACAKFGVTPDLSDYRAGHSQGIIQFCTERNGFALGRSGTNYNGACPADLEPTFLEAYSIGREIRQASHKIGRISSSIKAKQQEIEKITITKNEKEQLLIHGDLTPTERAILLSEIKDLDRAVPAIEDEIYDLEDHQKDAEAELNRLNIYQ